MTTPHHFDLYYYSEQRANCDASNWYAFEDYVEMGFTPERAKEWFDSDVTPEHAMAFQMQGMGPSDAWRWRLVPEIVAGFRARTFTQEQARDWADAEIFADEAMFWQHAGYSPSEAFMIRAASADVAQAVLWSLTGLSPADAMDHAAHGAEPVGFLCPPLMEAARAEDVCAPSLAREPEPEQGPGPRGQVVSESEGQGLVGTRRCG
ncbi:hypothetical protein ABEG17_02735 [Pedococcus sp. KACC 23699]|uniref:Uncharacterized protein n=1 Tax=Pedococcus sp. KACC 23699 TaxID=3149228 RepID=A0AAU7JVI5_9MICO